MGWKEWEVVSLTGVNERGVLVDSDATACLVVVHRWLDPMHACSCCETQRGEGGGAGPVREDRGRAGGGCMGRCWPVGRERGRLTACDVDRINANIAVDGLRSLVAALCGSRGEDAR